jgi:hypothetical protein
VRLGSQRTQADKLCAKLVAMAALMSRDEAMKHVLDVVKNHLG